MLEHKLSGYFHFLDFLGVLENSIPLSWKKMGSSGNVCVVLVTKLYLLINMKSFLKEKAKEFCFNIVGKLSFERHIKQR